MNKVNVKPCSSYHLQVYNANENVNLCQRISKEIRDSLKTWRQLIRLVINIADFRVLLTWRDEISFVMIIVPLQPKFLVPSMSDVDKCVEISKQFPQILLFCLSYLFNTQCLNK